MPDFVYRARNAEGVTADGRIDAETLDRARYALELRGFRDIEFYTGESEPDIRRMVLSGTDVDEADPEEWTATDTIESQQRRGVAAKIWWAFKQHSVFIGPLLVWNLLAWWGDRPFGWGDWAGFVLTPCYLVYFASLVLPMVIFDQLLQAAVWRDWPAQRRWIGAARFLRRLMRTGIPENELVIREANALAAGGNLSAALQHIETLRGHPDVADYLLRSRSSSLYEFAGDFAGQLRCVEEVVALNPAGADGYIDLASVRIRHFRDVAGARAALEHVADKELAQVARGVFLLVRGMVAVEAGDHAAAEQDLRASEKILSPLGNVLILGLLSLLQGYLALSLAATGRVEEARRRFASVRPLLVAQKTDRLRERVEAAVGSN